MLVLNAKWNFCLMNKYLDTHNGKTVAFRENFLICSKLENKGKKKGTTI